MSTPAGPLINATSIESDLTKIFEAKREVIAGNISFLQGAEEDAIRKFERALTLDPSDYDAAYLLARLYYEIGNRSKDAERWTEARTTYVKSTRVIDDFLEENHTSLSDHFDLDSVHALAHFDLGVLHLNSNFLEEAAEAFQNSTLGEVHYAEAHTNLGVIFERQGQDAEASRQYQRALEINPNHLIALINFGDVSLREKRYDRAIESFFEAQKLRPDFAPIYYNLGVAYFQQGQAENASEQWERALELDPDFTEAQTGLDVVRDQMENR